MSGTEDLTERIDDLEARVESLERLIHDEEAGEDIIGMREFVNEIDPSTHPERALAIAYHLDQYQGQENFSSKDIEEGYRTCRIQKPANLSDTLAKMEGKGWVMDDGEEGKLRLRRLTDDGLNEIEEVLENGT